MKKRYYYLIIALFAIASLFPQIIYPNRQITDASFHIANMADLVSGISLSHPFPKICSHIGYDLGYGSHIFYGQFPHYFGAYLSKLLDLFGFNLFHTLTLIYLIVAVISRHCYL